MELQQLSKEEENFIENHVRKALSNKPHLQLIVFASLLAKENARLAKEVNRLRTLAGEPPMKTYTPGV